mgnify:CR=1 FL=1
MSTTLVISDLHLGSRRPVDVLRRPAPLAALCERLAEVDRLVLLGDVLELRHGPLRDALAAARPVMEAIGTALPRGAEVVITPGNHDHALIAPWLRDRGLQGDSISPTPPAPLGLETRVPAAQASPERAAEAARETAAVLAQTPSANLDAVVVTARKREETLLDIPQEIQTISQQQLERANLSSVEDFSRFVG